MPRIRYFRLPWSGPRCRFRCKFLKILNDYDNFYVINVQIYIIFSGLKCGKIKGQNQRFLKKFLRSLGPFESRSVRNFFKNIDLSLWGKQFSFHELNFFQILLHCVTIRYPNPKFKIGIQFSALNISCRNNTDHNALIRYWFKRFV